MTQSFSGPPPGGYCPRCHQGYAVGPHVCPAPQRIQLRRAKGWRMPPSTVKVDRSTKWGNPFPASIYGIGLSLRLFANAVDGFWDPSVIPAARASEWTDMAYRAQASWRRGLGGHPREAIRRELAGKNLACWCRPGEPCHADILLEVANG